MYRYLSVSNSSIRSNVLLGIVWRRSWIRDLHAYTGQLTNVIRSLSSLFVADRTTASSHEELIGQLLNLFHLGGMHVTAELRSGLDGVLRLCLGRASWYFGACLSEY